MASLHLAGSRLSPAAAALRFFGDLRRRGSRPLLRVRCVGGGGGGGSNGEEPPESLFMKELRRRGMTPGSSSSSSSMLEERGAPYADGESKGALEAKEQSGSGGEGRRRGVAAAAAEGNDKGISSQRERSMALNSEGLEGLIPRAKLLLSIGGTFFFGFWPLIAITIAFFAALYFYLGPSFVHGGSKMSLSSPQYIDPSTLLEDEKISQVAPHVK
uniref:Uncharacterized protein n=1 Tax=Ananas comosus var. bracteatus TaxID=296719 RepID=A0A6V7NVP2_ANACO|nr:unnamed protein product [Ananas comosus var. bracteatus]